MTNPALESFILTIRGQEVLLDVDHTAIYGVPTKRLNEQVKRNTECFPGDFIFQLAESEKREVVANCDHLARLKFSKSLPHYFIKQRELIAGLTEILKKLTQMDAKRLEHDDALRLIWLELQPLLAPPPVLPNKEIGFHIREDSPKYRTKAKQGVRDA